MRINTQQRRNDEARTVSLGSLVVDEALPSPIAIIYRSEIDYISRCILDSPSIETGGQLFGFWTGTGIPVVLYAIGPGPRANHQVTFFNQDVDYLEAVGGELIRRYALQHIGEWHSHHRLGLAHPSGHDASTMHGSIARQRLRRFLLCIGNCDDGGRESTLNAFSFHCNTPRDYVHAAWCIQELESPFRPIVDRDLASLLCHPRTRRPSHGPNYIAVDRPVEPAPIFSDDYWLRNRANSAVLKQIVDFLAPYDAANRPAVTLDDAGRVTIALAGAPGETTEVFFPDGFPAEAPEISLAESLRPDYIDVDGKAVMAPMARDIWQPTGDIAADFILCFERLTGTMPPPPDQEQEQDQDPEQKQEPDQEPKTPEIPITPNTPNSPEATPEEPEASPLPIDHQLPQHDNNSQEQL